MRVSQMWFGIPGQSMLWTPAPAAGLQKNLKRFTETVQLENGRQVNFASPQFRVSFTGDFYGDATDLSGIDVFNKFASGFYGGGNLIFLDPYAAQSNLFAPHWASPALAEQGWDQLTGPTQLIPASFGDLPVDLIQGRPPRYVSYPISTPVNEASSREGQYNHYLAVRPDHTLYVGVSGDATGAAAVMLQTFNSDNTSNAPMPIPLLNYADDTQMNMAFSGSQYSAVRIYLSRTANVSSRLALFSMMAQSWDSVLTPSLDGVHQAGQGHLGLRITDDAIAETYQYNGVKKGLSLTLEESV